MEISFDPRKREETLARRDLDFRDAPTVFAGPVLEYVDDRIDYGELRWITVGYLNKRMVMLVWTERRRMRHIISMRKCNDREQKIYGRQLGS